MTYTSRLRLLLVLVCAGIALFMVPAVASADTVTNNVGANTTVRIPAGTSVTVGYRMLQRNKDGQKGCNASATNPAILTINAPAAVSVAPASKQLLLKNCKQPQLATFTATSQGGPYTISVTIAPTDPTAPGTYDTSSATFMLLVLPPPDADAPQLTVHFPAPNGTNGWYVSKPVMGTLTAADPSTVTALECVGATVVTVTGINTAVASAEIVVNNEGATYVSCQATDGSTTPHTGVAPGSTYAADVSIDTVPPAVANDLDRVPDANNWYNHSLTISFLGEDDSAGIDACDDPVVYSGPDQANASVSGSCSDLAGNQAASQAAVFKYDATAPFHVRGTPDRLPDFRDGYRSAVTVTFSGVDAVSGADPDSLSCTEVTYQGPASPLVRVSGTCTDPAGNTSGTASYSFKFFASISLPFVRR